jgi:hypothetical protein
MCVSRPVCVYAPVRGSGSTYTEVYAHLVHVVLEYVSIDTFAELSGGYVSTACAGAYWVRSLLVLLSIRYILVRHSNSSPGRPMK